MDERDVIDISRQAMQVALYVGGPVLIVGMVVGLLIGLLQALTQIQDQTVSFVPKVIAMVIALSLSLPWLIQVMLDFTAELFTQIPSYGSSRESSFLCKNCPICVILSVVLDSIFTFMHRN